MRCQILGAKYNNYLRESEMYLVTVDGIMEETNARKYVTLLPWFLHIIRSTRRLFAIVTLVKFRY